MQIEIYADVVCPWCYLGKRRLEAALARSLFATDAVLRWRPFQLYPDLPRAGTPTLNWLSPRYGGVDRARAAMAQVSRAAEQEGLRLDFERAVIANTFDAHRLLWFADQPESVFAGATAQTQPELAEALHRAYFCEGLDIADHEVLADLAEQVGLERYRVQRLLATNEATADVRGHLARAYDLGITSVPTFVFSGTYAVTGAQDVRAMTSVLAEVARRVRVAPAVATLVPRQRTSPAAADGDTRVA